MKNLIVIFALTFVLSMFTMELAKISEQNVQSFAQHLSMAVKYGEIKIKEKVIAEDNSIYLMLHQLHYTLKNQHSGNIIKMVESDSTLQARINAFTVVNSNELVKFPLQQIRQKVADVAGAQAYLIRTRQILAGLEFLKKQPMYSNAWINEVGKEDRIGFMQRNQDYPISDNSIKDYWSLFIYQSLIAPIID